MPGCKAGCFLHPAGRRIFLLHIVKNISETIGKGDVTMNITALTLVIVGALNWLLVGLFQFDVVAAIFGGSAAVVSRIIYIIIGIAGLWSIGIYPRLTKGSE